MPIAHWQPCTNLHTARGIHPPTQASSVPALDSVLTVLGTGDSVMNKTDKSLGKAEPGLAPGAGHTLLWRTGPS